MCPLSYKAMAARGILRRPLILGVKVSNHGFELGTSGQKLSGALELWPKKLSPSMYHFSVLWNCPTLILPGGVQWASSGFDGYPPWYVLPLSLFLPLQVTFLIIETKAAFSPPLIAGNILEYPFHFTGSPVQVQKWSQGNLMPRSWSRSASRPRLELPNAEWITASQVERMFLVVIRQLLKTETIFPEPKSTSEV